MENWSLQHNYPVSIMYGWKITQTYIKLKSKTSWNVDLFVVERIIRANEQNLFSITGVKIDIWTSLGCYMDLSKFIHGFLSNVIWICQICYMDVLKFFYGVCQSCFMYFSPYAKQKQVEVWPRFQSLLKQHKWIIMKKFWGFH